MGACITGTGSFVGAHVQADWNVHTFAKQIQVTSTLDAAPATGLCLRQVVETMFTAHAMCVCTTGQHPCRTLGTFAGSEESPAQIWTGKIDKYRPVALRMLISRSSQSDPIEMKKLGCTRLFGLH